MIIQSYRLISPKQIRADFINLPVNADKVIIRPTYLSICAADQRYYQGRRPQEVLIKKLPMALIHEAVGRVVYDPTNTFNVGDKVVMIPNTPVEKDDIVKENYLRSSSFKSSGVDGFMQELVALDKNRVIKYDKISDNIAVLLELMSVSMNALEHFVSYSHMRKQVLGVWGCGSLGFTTALILKKTFPNAKIVVFGTKYDKLHYFQFADELYHVSHIPPDLTVDHAFECVGGQGAELAINQIIDLIKPQGSISLLGVSENNVALNTRMILEKGLSLFGNSRSGYEDFYNSIEFIYNYPDVVDYLSNIISEEVVVKDEAGIHTAFEKDLSNSFKTIIKWDI